jgi:hypothetical protein
MALVQIHAGRVEIVAKSRVRASTLPGQLANPPGGLYPMRSAAFEIDEYRVLEGWPVPVPSCDIRCDTLVSGDGVMLAERETPTGVLTGANYRWVADDDFFNPTTLSWVPIQGSEPTWTAPVDNLPSLINNYEYTVDDERFTSMTALNFDSDTSDYLTTDLSRVMSTVNGYTVIMVMSPNSVFGNNEDRRYNAIWTCEDSPAETNFTVTIEDGYLWVQVDQTENQRGIAMSRAMSIQAPSYLALVFNRPKMAMYLSQGPKDIIVKRLDIAPSNQPFCNQILLGKMPGADLTHTADMALFDLGLYADALSADQVKDEFTLLSKIYGGQ